MENCDGWREDAPGFLREKRGGSPHKAGQSPALRLDWQAEKNGERYKVLLTIQYDLYFVLLNCVTLSILLVFGSLFGGLEELREGGLVEIFPAEPDGLDLGGVVDVGKGVGAQEHEVGEFAGSDDAGR